MAERRQYRLLCPIARALDVLGDRWTLLILRDLHAGPARFQELEQGLHIATNLLSTRLAELIESGMIERLDGPGSSGYRLTEAGRSTEPVLWELTRFGTGLPRDVDPREPGNLRTVALPLRVLLRSVTDRPDLRASLFVDDAEFTITSNRETVEVEWGATPDSTELIARTSYEAFLDVGEGLMSFDDFVANHLDFDSGEGMAPAFLDLLGSAMAA